MRDLPKSTFIFLCCAVVLTLLTGFVGWSMVYLPSPSRDFGDVFYHTLLAFTGDGSYVAAEDGTKHNIWIRIARVSGIVATLSAIVAMTVAFMGQRLLRWRAGVQVGHSVVIGASPFALDMVPEDRKLVVIDTAEALEEFKERRRKSALLLLPDIMTDLQTVRDVIGKPKEVILGDADTVVNVERARLVLNVRPDVRDRIKLRIEDNTVARDLNLLSDDFKHAVQISRSDTIARALVSSMAPTSLAELRGQDRVHIALIGMGRVNLAVAEELALRCHHYGQKSLRLTIVDRDINGAETRIRTERPDLLSPDFDQHDFSINFLEMNALECCSADKVEIIQGLENNHPLTAIVVSAGDNARNLAIAMRLRQLQVEKLCLKAPVFVRSDSQTSVAAAPFTDLTGGIVPFGGRKLNADDLKLEALYEKLARNIHERYLASPSVERTDENSWVNMPVHQKRASYRAALSAVELYHAAGFQAPIGHPLAGLRLDPVSGNSALGDAALIAKLAQCEKERWNTERRLEGFVAYKNGPRDNEKKHHNLIMPYDDLLKLNKPEEVRKDIDIVRATLHEGVASHEAAPGRPVWRKRLRVGVIGPLKVDAGKISRRIESITNDIISSRPETAHMALEIVTPNAPGFDRVAALALAYAWKAQTGRECRVALINAADPTVVDELAMDYLTGGKDKDRGAIKQRLEMERDALLGLSREGFEIRSIDMRGFGVSNTDLMANKATYDVHLSKVQDHVLAVSDEVIFDTAGGSATWTVRALAAWEKAKGRPGHLV